MATSNYPGQIGQVEQLKSLIGFLVPEINLFVIMEIWSRIILMIKYFYKNLHVFCVDIQKTQNLTVFCNFVGLNFYHKGLFLVLYSE